MQFILLKKFLFHGNWNVTEKNHRSSFSYQDRQPIVLTLLVRLRQYEMWLHFGRLFVGHPVYCIVLVQRAYFYLYNFHCEWQLQANMKFQKLHISAPHYFFRRTNQQPWFIWRHTSHACKSSKLTYHQYKRRLDRWSKCWNP